MTTPTFQRLAVIGAGKMGETLIRALVAAGTVEPSGVIATAKSRRRQTALTELPDCAGIRVTGDNREAVQGADLVLLCVKPQVAAGVLAEVDEVLEEGQLLVSILAGASTELIERQLSKKVAVVRAMPNTPSLVGAGMTGLTGGRWASPEQLDAARQVFDRVGRTVVLDEKYMDAVTGLSASGVAFLYIVIEALAEGGVKVGLPRSVATELAAQACYGAGKMVLDTESHPALLKDAVTTPAGCTIDGILKLEEGGLRVTLIKAIVEATRRAQELVE